jgi:sulfate transport system ATP-binding protein
MSIQVEHICKQYGSFTALADVSLTIGSGELMALLGPSGSGKTTLLRIIAGLESPDDGSILLHGEETTQHSASKRGIGFVFQHYALFRHLTISENVAFGLRVQSRQIRPSRRGIRERVQELLHLVQLDSLAKMYPERAETARGIGSSTGRPAQGTAPRRTLQRLGCEGAQGTAGLAAPNPR